MTEPKSNVCWDSKKKRKHTKISTNIIIYNFRLNLNGFVHISCLLHVIIIWLVKVIAPINIADIYISFKFFFFYRCLINKIILLVFDFTCCIICLEIFLFFCCFFLPSLYFENYADSYSYKRALHFFCNRSWTWFFVCIRHDNW